MDEKVASMIETYKGFSKEGRQRVLNVITALENVKKRTNQERKERK